MRIQDNVIPIRWLLSRILTKWLFIVKNCIVHLILHQVEVHVRNTLCWVVEKYRLVWLLLVLLNLGSLFWINNFLFLKRNMRGILLYLTTMTAITQLISSLLCLGLVLVIISCLAITYYQSMLSFRL